MKIGLFVGASTFLAYSYSNRFLPRGLALGDSLFLLFIALCFGLMYGLSIFALTNLGVAFSPLLRAVLRAVNCVLRKAGKKELQLVRLYEFSWFSLFFGTYGLLIVILFWIKSWDLGFSALALSIILYILLSSIMYWQSEVDRLHKEISSEVEIKGRDRSHLAPGIRENRTKVVVSAGILALTPLILSNISSTFVEGAMRLAGVRIDSALVYLKTPYNVIISDKFVVKDCPIMAEHSCFRLAIPFTGIGSTTLVQELESASGKPMSVEVPNESIIIVRGR